MSAGAGFYEQIKADLGYLYLDAATSSFAVFAEEARTNDWSHIEFLARLVAEQAAADRDRRLAARLRYARFPYRRRIEDFDFEFQPGVDHKLVEDLATLGSSRRTDRSCSSVSPTTERPISLSRSPPSRLRPATAATSPPLTPCAKT